MGVSESKYTTQGIFSSFFVRGISIKDIATQTVAERIKFVRGNVSREDFAHAIGVHKNTVGRYERGESEPEISVTTQICLKFNIDPHWLLFGDGTEPRIDEYQSTPYFREGGKVRGTLLQKRIDIQDSTDDNTKLLAEIITNLVNDEALPLGTPHAPALASLYYPEMKSRLIHLSGELKKLIVPLS